MTLSQQASGKIAISFREALGLLGPYAAQRVLEQLKSIWVIILYLIVFQRFVLGIAIADASLIAFGMALVIVGLSFFMEGLVLGLMPLGQIVGVKLPQKSHVLVVLAFSLVLGFLATLAEPAIQVLQTAGRAVKPWEAPLLFLLLTRYPDALVYAVGAGVGMAVAFGMLRFYYNWSLKPFIYLLVVTLLALTAWSLFDANMLSIAGLAWDCGAVTTGPVTVPLVLALGIGISRVVGAGESGTTTGFGVVTLASLFPILSVLVLGAALLKDVPPPGAEADFLRAENREKAARLFESRDRMAGYVLLYGSQEGKDAFFGGEGNLLEFLENLEVDRSRWDAVVGDDPDARARIMAVLASAPGKAIEPGPGGDGSGLSEGSAPQERKAYVLGDLLLRNMKAAVKAIGLLTVPLFLVLFLLVRQKIPHPDEILLGLCFTVLGMGVFSIGIELGLDKLGTQVGSMLPSSFKVVALSEQRRNIDGFDPASVVTAISAEGRNQQLFHAVQDGKVVHLPYDEKAYDPGTGKYHYTPTRGPLFGEAGGPWGFVVVLIFGFLMGYGATLAEPALNALGMTVEEITVGTFKKLVLMQAVAVGVGIGIAAGVAKILWDFPLFWILGPLYLLLLFLSKISTEEFVNIAWDSAGVTTGPITVPLVLAMGLGIGSQIGVVEGFGILASASVCPIVTVLTVGLHVNRKRQAALSEPRQAPAA